MWENLLFVYRPKIFVWQTFLFVLISPHYCAQKIFHKKCKKISSSAPEWGGGTFSTSLEMQYTGQKRKTQILIVVLGLNKSRAILVNPFVDGIRGTHLCSLFVQFTFRISTWYLLTLRSHLKTATDIFLLQMCKKHFYVSKNGFWDAALKKLFYTSKTGDFLYLLALAFSKEVFLEIERSL